MSGGPVRGATTPSAAVRRAPASYPEGGWRQEISLRRHSAHIQERYTRVDQYNMKLAVTVDDPKFYTKPWTSLTAEFYWMKNQEFSESFCIPSEGIEYRDSLTKPYGIQVVK